MIAGTSSSLSVRHVAAVGQVTVAQQHWVQLLVGLDAGGVLGHDVGAVEEVGDAAETLGLALQGFRRRTSITIMINAVLYSYTLA